jgi:hypothetical protein
MIIRVTWGMAITECGLTALEAHNLKAKHMCMVDRVESHSLEYSKEHRKNWLREVQAQTPMAPKGETPNLSCCKEGEG